MTGITRHQVHKSYHSIALYHTTFQGDTYDACAVCGGKCEKHKIATLLPGEKEYMSRHLGLSIRNLEQRYLDQLDTPFGCVDVLKMADGCRFLDSHFRCRAVKAKPILCDSYPVVFAVRGKRIRFSIDKRDCPLVHMREYSDVVRDFADRGIPAMQDLLAPLGWWKTVALYDEFDVDYTAIENTRKTLGYETFMLEEVLGFACNGYEEAARRRGLRLLLVRLRELRRRVLETVRTSGSKEVRFARLLRSSYRYALASSIDHQVHAVRKASADSLTLREQGGPRYRLMVAETREALKRLEHDALTYSERLRGASRMRFVPRTPLCSDSDRIARPSARFTLPGMEIDPSLRAHEVVSFDGRDAAEGYALLARAFAPDEIDDAGYISKVFRSKARRRSNLTRRRGRGAAGQMWHRWIMGVLRDPSGRLLSAADGAVIANRHRTLFYFSHIATRPDLRGKGLGQLLTSYMLEAANAHLREAKDALGNTRWPVEKSGVYLMQEIGEIEFPSSRHVAAPSVLRLGFHSRAGRRVLWPYRYAQPDTNYHLPRFHPEEWNSVPMFVAHRCFVKAARGVDEAVEAVELLYDYFGSTGDLASLCGVEWDRAHLRLGLRRDGRPRLIAMPNRREAIASFATRTGYLENILPEYYPQLRYTRQRLEVFELTAKVSAASGTHR